VGSGAGRVLADLEEGFTQQLLEFALALEQPVMARLKGIELLLELVADRLGCRPPGEPGEQMGNRLPCGTDQGDVRGTCGRAGREEHLSGGASQGRDGRRTGCGLPRSGGGSLQEGRQGFEQLIMRGASHLPS
jgi:hypothetical protein